MIAVILFRALLLCTVSLNLIGCTALSSLWTPGTDYRWTQFAEANFPAKVDQIITEYGNLLDRRHKAGYGEWDVSITSEPAVATYTCPPNETCQIVVNKLRCTNARSEKTACAVRLDVKKRVCGLLLSERKQALSIRCPLDIVLAPVTFTPGGGATASPSKQTTVARSR